MGYDLKTAPARSTTQFRRMSQSFTTALLACIKVESAGPRRLEVGLEIRRFVATVPCAGYALCIQDMYESLFQSSSALMLGIWLRTDSCCRPYTRVLAVMVLE